MTIKNVSGIVYQHKKSYFGKKDEKRNRKETKSMDFVVCL